MPTRRACDVAMENIDVTFMKDKFDNICCAQKAMSSSIESEHYYVQDAVKQKVLEEKLTYKKEKRAI
jgi:hypothetical protein